MMKISEKQIDGKYRYINSENILQFVNIFF